MTTGPASGSAVRLTPAGLYCEAGDFFIDPWSPELWRRTPALRPR